jgi:hypothetical protein
MPPNGSRHSTAPPQRVLIFSGMISRPITWGSPPEPPLPKTVGEHDGFGRIGQVILRFQTWKAALLGARLESGRLLSKFHSRLAARLGRFHSGAQVFQGEKVDMNIKFVHQLRILTSVRKYADDSA